jgi:hypothetical protein
MISDIAVELSELERRHFTKLFVISFLLFSWEATDESWRKRRGRRRRS